jgi:hypothetical protein
MRARTVVVLLAPVPALRLAPVARARASAPGARAPAFPGPPVSQSSGVTTVRTGRGIEAAAAQGFRACLSGRLPRGWGRPARGWAGRPVHAAAVGGCDAAAGGASVPQAQILAKSGISYPILSKPRRL